MANRAEDLRWEHTATRAADSQKVALTREAIVKAAFLVADTQGLDAVSIRRVATELGVGPMSLYTHISAKADLIALMANELVSEMLVSEPLSTDWREALSQIARRSHRAFVSHPWALEAFARRPRLGPNVVLHAKQMARAVASLRLSPSDVWTLLGIVDDYVLGHALRVATSGNAQDLENALTPIDLSEFPELASLSSVDLQRATSHRFEVGLQTVLEGVERTFLGDRAAREQRPGGSGQH